MVLSLSLIALYWVKYLLKKVVNYIGNNNPEIYRPSTSEGRIQDL